MTREHIFKIKIPNKYHLFTNHPIATELHMKNLISYTRVRVIDIDTCIY